MNMPQLTESGAENQKVPSNRIKRVKLLGKGQGWEQCPDNEPGIELWGLNGLLFANKKLDKIFMMDILDEMPSVISGTWELNDIIEQANRLKIPFIGPYKYEEIPTSEAYPIEEAAKEFGIPYFNNTIAYMICYALLRGVEEIQIWGINQASGTEYFYEKGCVEYWLGIATGMGVKVSIHGKHSELLANKARYGGTQLYGYNTTYEQLIKARQRFGDFLVKKLIRPEQEGRTMFLGPEKSRGLRTVDIVGIKRFYNQFVAPYGNLTPEAKWTIKLNDAMNIARYAIEQKPKRILDLGTGIGTSSAMAKYSYPVAEVVSVEQFSRVREIAEKNLKRMNVAVKTEHCEPELFTLKETPGITFSGFKGLPKGKWDMVIIDGPGPFKHEGVVVEMPNGDVFRILNDINTGAIVYVDGRKDAVKLMMRYLSPYLKLVVSSPSTAGFVRTEKPYSPEEVKDGLLESLLSENYF